MNTTSRTIPVSIILWLTAKISSSYRIFMHTKGKTKELKIHWSNLKKEQELYEELIKMASEGSEALYETLEDYGVGVVNDPAYWFIANQICSWEQETIQINFES